MCVTIGYSQFEIGETSIVLNDTDRDREIETFIYYPATSSGEGVPVSEGQFPLIVVGHGFVMSYTSYAYLWEHFVSLGYIVVLPNTETAVDVSHEDFGMDLSYAVNAMQSEGDLETSIFYEHIGLKSAVLGHSMGGGAAVLAAAENPSISTLITLAAAETDPSAIAAASSITIPSLTFAGNADCVTPPAEHQELIYNNLSDCKGYVLISEGTHCQFANSNPLCELGEFSCPSVDLDEPEQHAIILDVLTPWLDAYLKNNFDAWETVVTLEGINDQYEFTLDCADNAPVLNLPDNSTEKLTIYPTPFNHSLFLSHHIDQGRYEIYTLDGRMVLSGVIMGKEIQLSKLGNGTYIMRIESSEGVILHQKIVKH